MSHFQSATGFVLAWNPVREADRVYTFLFEKEGKMSVRTKGGAKGLAKLTPHLEVPGEVDCLLVHGRTNEILIGVERVSSFGRVISSYDRLFLFQSAARLVELSLAEGQGDRAVFELLRAWGHFLDAVAFDLSVERRAFLLSAFALKLLSLVGFHPELHRCLSCQKRVQEDNFWWQSLRGGVVCGACRLRDQEQWFSATTLETHVMVCLRFARDRSFEEMLCLHLPITTLESFHVVVDALLATHLPLIPANSLRFSCPA